MFIEVLPENLPGHLETLSRSGILTPFYMAGGTGLALQLGHRRSVDLDFFTLNTFDSAHIAESLTSIGDFVINSKSPGTLHGMFHDIKLSFFEYPYPLLKNLHNCFGIPIADSIDIGCMKIDAISSRGSRKDFIDLYVICCEITTLHEMLGYFERKYQGIKYNKMHILKSLVYFTDAEQEPLPFILKNIKWDDVKKFFIEQVKSVSKHWL